MNADEKPSEFERRWLHASRCLYEAYSEQLLPSWLIDTLHAKTRRQLRPNDGGLVSGDALVNLLGSQWKVALMADRPEAQRHVLNEAERALVAVPGYLSKYLRQSGNAVEPSHALSLLSIAFDATTDQVAKRALSVEIVRISKDLLRADDAQTTKIEAFLPRSQQSAYEQLVAIGNAFFSPRPEGLRLTPRLAPLLVGPTGAGKTYLATRAAKALGARHMKTAFGDWMPMGCVTDFKPTLLEILGLVSQHDRVVLILDELDKWTPDFSTSWARSCSTDLWQLLDRAPSQAIVADFMRKNLMEDKPLKSGELFARLERNLFVIGIGTWQSLHTPPQSLGFGANTKESPSDALRRIRAQKDISEELMLRFSELLYVGYPTPNETLALYEQSGLTILAGQLGIELDPLNHDWSRGGMRSLEQVAAKLLVAAQRQQAQQMVNTAKTEVNHA